LATNIKEYAIPATAQERVYARIRDMVLSGELRQGERIVERQLAEKVGSSRVPVREALLRLSSDGLLTSVPRWGYQVRKYDMIDVIELYDLREAIEGQAIRLICERATDEQIEKIVLAHEKMKKYVEQLRDGRDDKTGDYDDAFHYAILNASGNSRFVRIFSVFNDEHICLMRGELGLHQLAVDRSKLYQEVQEKHQEIVDAIIVRDANRAERVLREHIRDAKRDVEELMRRRGDLK
jgi:DNA-binding GntR family transcriptional regulator